MAVGTIIIRAQQGRQRRGRAAPYVGSRVLSPTWNGARDQAAARSAMESPWSARWQSSNRVRGIQLNSWPTCRSRRAINIGHERYTAVNHHGWASILLRPQLTADNGDLQAGDQGFESPKLHLGKHPDPDHGPGCSCH